MTDATKQSWEGRGGPAEAAGELGLKGRHDPEMSLEVAWVLTRLWQSRSGGWESAGGRKPLLPEQASTRTGVPAWAGRLALQKGGTQQRMAVLILPGNPDLGDRGREARAAELQLCAQAR